MKGKKTGGRTKGATNKVTRETKERITWVLSVIDTTLENDIKLLAPRDRVLLWKDLQEFISPKLARTEVKHEGDLGVHTTVDFKGDIRDLKTDESIGDN